MSRMDNLLSRYHEGSLNPEELDELNRLTHRDQVLHVANQQARSINRRRYTAVTGVAAVLLVTGVIFFVSPSVDNALPDSPVVAKADMPKPSGIVPDVQSVHTQRESTFNMEETNHKTRQYDTTVLQPKPSLVSPIPAEHLVNVETVVEQLEPSAIVDEPIVACNTECSPDSVINDIWKFLRT